MLCSGCFCGELQASSGGARAQGLLQQGTGGYTAAFPRAGSHPNAFGLVKGTQLTHGSGKGSRYPQRIKHLSLAYFAFILSYSFTAASIFFTISKLKSVTKGKDKVGNPLKAFYSVDF